MQEADLEGANLQAAKLFKALFVSANLSYAMLQGADLEAVNLCGANLLSANLTNTNLSSVKNLAKANNLASAIIDEWTALPDQEQKEAEITYPSNYQEMQARRAKIPAALKASSKVGFIIELQKIVLEYAGFSKIEIVRFGSNKQPVAAKPLSPPAPSNPMPLSKRKRLFSRSALPGSKRLCRD